jgi:hypothetical protein
MTPVPHRGASQRRQAARISVVPYIGAGLAASILGWWIDDLLQPYLGSGITLAVSFVCSTAVFFVVRNWLLDLRGH